MCTLAICKLCIPCRGSFKRTLRCLCQHSGCIALPQQPGVNRLAEKRQQQEYTHTHTHARTHARTHTCTHTKRERDRDRQTDRNHNHLKSRKCVHMYMGRDFLIFFSCTVEGNAFYNTLLPPSSPTFSPLFPPCLLHDMLSVRHLKWRNAPASLYHSQRTFAGCFSAHNQLASEWAVSA